MEVMNISLVPGGHKLAHLKPTRKGGNEYPLLLLLCYVLTFRSHKFRFYHSEGFLSCQLGTQPMKIFPLHF